MTYRILPTARLDVLNAETRLEAEHPGYGDAFGDEFVAAVQAIAAQPRLHSPAPDGPSGVECREYFIRRFNYRVLFVIDGDEVVFVAVPHAHAKPGAWRRRLSGGG